MTELIGYSNGRDVINDDGDIVPFEQLQPTVDAFEDDEIQALADQEQVKIVREEYDPLEDKTDKLGSYELGSIALGRVNGYTAPTGVPPRPIQKRRRRSGHGPQYGEEVFPVVDQRRSEPEKAEIRKNIAPIAEELGRRAAERRRVQAVADKSNPDAYVRAYHERRTAHRHSV